MIYYQEPNATIYRGHAIDVLKDMLPESVDCVPTSPPYWGLRSYKTEPIIWDDNNCEHEWGEAPPRRSRKAGDIKDLNSKEATNTGNLGIELPTTNFCLKCGAWKGELGLEPTIELYISHLIQIFNEVKRVLKKTGTVWVNIGDSYAANRSYQVPDSKWVDVGNYMPRKIDSIPAKSLCLIPERFALGMVERGWILRNNIIWYKSNSMPESVKDRFTGTYEYLYFFTKSRKYWFEQQFEEQHPDGRKQTIHLGCPKYGDGEVNKAYAVPHERWGNPLGRNKRDVWEITTQPYPEAHFATFPEKLCETPILAGCPSMICKKCGKAREKIYKVVGHQVTEAMRIAGCDSQGDYDGQDLADYEAGLAQSPSDSKRRILESMSEVKEAEYTDCGCDEGFEPGVVLDPFAGAGTTGAVAKRLGRKYIGIDISAQYCKLHKKRLQGIPMPMRLEV